MAMVVAVKHTVLSGIIMINVNLTLMVITGDFDHHLIMLLSSIIPTSIMAY